MNADNSRSDEPLVVTIVTPSYQQGQFIELTIRSVLAQSYGPIEYIIIDGRSTDNTVGTIKCYQDKIAYWESEPDRGQSHAINKGLKRSKGQIIGWLNSDDVLLPFTVSSVVAYFHENPDIDVIYGHLHRIDENGRQVPTPILPKDRVVFNNLTAIGECVVNQPGSFWRRSIMEKVGLLNESLHYALDYEYWVRMLLAGGRFARLDQPVAKFRLSSESKTVGSTVKAAIEHMQVTDDFLAIPDLAEQLNLSASELHRQARKSKAIQCLYASWGSTKTKNYPNAARWAVKAIRYDPSVILRRRWMDLAISKTQRS